MDKRRLTLEHWEAVDEYVVCIDKKPVGGTVSGKQGRSIIDWLETVPEDVMW